MDPLLKTGMAAIPAGPRMAIKAIRKAPEAVKTGTDVATAKDRWREIAGMAGEVVGSAIGGALGVPVGTLASGGTPAIAVTVPVATIAGKVYGGAVGKDVFENVYDEYADDVIEGVPRAWNGARQATADAVTRGWGSSQTDARIRRMMGF